MKGMPRRRKRPLAAVGIVTMAIVLLCVGGCYRSPLDTTWYTPHVYKGARDPLLAKLKTRQLADTLDERVFTVQTDR